MSSLDLNLDDFPIDVDEYPPIEEVAPDLLLSMSPEYVEESWPETVWKSASYDFSEQGLEAGVNVKFEQGAVGPQAWKAWLGPSSGRASIAQTKRCQTPGNAIEYIQSHF